MEFLTDNARLGWTRASARAARALTFAVTLVGAVPCSRAAAPAPTEYQLKAVFLFNFALFVEWPSETFAAPDEPFVIGILGDDPFGSALDETVRGEMVRQRRFVVRRFRNAAEVDRCQILFVSRSEEDRVAAILTKIKQRGILTVGDAPNFSHSGGMIRLATVQNKIQLKINLEAARAAGLTLSSKLLRPAEIVSGGGG